MESSGGGGHTRWNCRYHVAFAPKCRCLAFYINNKRYVGQILRRLCERKNLRIFEAQACAHYIHMGIEIPPKYSVASIMGYIKGKSSVMLHDHFGELKLKYRGCEFWCRGYFVDTTGKNIEGMREYISMQLETDRLAWEMVN